jgi:hypothetical protein
VEEELMLIMLSLAALIYLPAAALVPVEGRDCGAPHPIRCPQPPMPMMTTSNAVGYYNRDQRLVSDECPTEQQCPPQPCRMICAADMDLTTEIYEVDGGDRLRRRRSRTEQTAADDKAIVQTGPVVRLVGMRLTIEPTLREMLRGEPVAAPWELWEQPLERQ